MDNSLGTNIFPINSVLRRFFQNKREEGGASTSGTLPAPRGNKMGGKIKNTIARKAITPGKPTSVWDEVVWNGSKAFEQEMNNSKKTVVEVILAPFSYPQKKFSSMDILNLEKYIGQALALEQPPNIPRFRKTLEKDGTFITICENQFSCNWLYTYIQNLNSEQKTVKMGIKKKVPCWRVSFVVPDALTDDHPLQVIHKLELQNPSLTGRLDFQGTQKEDNVRELICVVDEKGMESIMQMKRKAFLGMQKIAFKI